MPARLALVGLAALCLCGRAAAQYTPYPTLGEQSTIVIVATWAGKSAPDMATVQSRVAFLNDPYTQENSYSACWLTPTILGPYTLPEPCTSRDAVYAHVRGLGIEPLDYNYRILVIPANTECRESGGGQEMTVFGTSSLGTWLEEYQHLLGLGHGGRYDCGDVAFDPEGCTWIEYEPYFGGALHITAPYKEYLRWVEPLRVTETGVYRLTPFALTGSVLRVSGRYNGQSYHFYLSYRLPIGLDDNALIGADRGVMFHIDVAVSSLLDMQPQVPYRYALPVGASFRDSGDFGTWFYVLSADSAGADVQIVIDETLRPLVPTTWGQIKAKYGGH